MTQAMKRDVLDVRQSGERTALVTGAAGAIGQAITRRLRSAGIRVVGLDRVWPENVKECDNKPDFLLTVNLANSMDLGAALNQLKNGDGVNPDIVVNNAAVYPQIPLLATSSQVYSDVLRINTLAAAEIIRHTAEAMQARRWGRIINVTSIVFNGGWSGLGAYTVSKGALLGLTRSAARELGPFEITVNAVAPGAIPTAAEPGGANVTREVLARQCLPFRGSPDDVAAAIAFLASDDARFITGQTVTVDGGWTMT